VASFWTNADGALLVDENGNPYFTDECCCSSFCSCNTWDIDSTEECPHFDYAIDTMSFGYGPMPSNLKATSTFTVYQVLAGDPWARHNKQGRNIWYLGRGHTYAPWYVCNFTDNHKPDEIPHGDTEADCEIEHTDANSTTYDVREYTLRGGTPVGDCISAEGFSISNHRNVWLPDAAAGAYMDFADGTTAYGIYVVLGEHDSALRATSVVADLVAGETIHSTVQSLGVIRTPENGSFSVAFARDQWGSFELRNVHADPDDTSLVSYTIECEARGAPVKINQVPIEERRSGALADIAASAFDGSPLWTWFGYAKTKYNLGELNASNASRAAYGSPLVHATHHEKFTVNWCPVNYFEMVTEWYPQCMQDDGYIAPWGKVPAWCGTSSYSPETIPQDPACRPVSYTARLLGRPVQIVGGDGEDVQQSIAPEWLNVPLHEDEEYGHLSGMHFRPWNNLNDQHVYCIIPLSIDNYPAWYMNNCHGSLDPAQFAYPHPLFDSSAWTEDEADGVGEPSCGVGAERGRKAPSYKPIKCKAYYPTYGAVRPVRWYGRQTFGGQCPWMVLKKRDISDETEWDPCTEDVPQAAKGCALWHWIPVYYTKTITYESCDATSNGEPIRFKDKRTQECRVTYDYDIRDGHYCDYEGNPRPGYNYTDECISAVVPCRRPVGSKLSQDEKNDGCEKACLMIAYPDWACLHVDDVIIPTNAWPVPASIMSRLYLSCGSNPCEDPEAQFLIPDGAKIVISGSYTWSGHAENRSENRTIVSLGQVGVEPTYQGYDSGSRTHRTDNAKVSGTYNCTYTVVTPIDLRTSDALLQNCVVTCNEAYTADTTLDDRYSSFHFWATGTTVTKDDEHLTSSIPCPTPATKTATSYVVRTGINISLGRVLETKGCCNVLSCDLDPHVLTPNWDNGGQGGFPYTVCVTKVDNGVSTNTSYTDNTGGVVRYNNYTYSNYVGTPYEDEPWLYCNKEVTDINPYTANVWHCENSVENNVGTRTCSRQFMKIDGMPGLDCVPHTSQSQDPTRPDNTDTSCHERYTEHILTQSYAVEVRVEYNQ